MGALSFVASTVSHQASQVSLPCTRVLWSCLGRQLLQLLLFWDVLSICSSCFEGYDCLHCAVVLFSFTPCSSLVCVVRPKAHAQLQHQASRRIIQFAAPSDRASQNATQLSHRAGGSGIFGLVLQCVRNWCINNSMSSPCEVQHSTFGFGISAAAGQTASASLLGPLQLIVVIR